MKHKLVRILFILSILSFSALAFAQKKSPNAQIIGQIQNKGTYNKIYIDTLNLTNPWIFATADIKPDGSFQFDVPIPRTDIYKLRLDDKNTMMLILSPGEVIYLNVKNNRLGSETEIKGSFHTKLLYDNVKLTRSSDAKADSLRRKYNELNSNPDNKKFLNDIEKQYNLNDSITKSSLKAQIDKHPASLAWLFFTDRFKGDMPTLEKIDGSLYKTYPYNPYVVNQHQIFEVEKKTAIGSEAPEIALPDTEGKTRKLSSLRGKLVLIDFWASWCGPCRRESPNVVRLYNEFRDKGFEIFSVSLDKDRTSWVNAIAKDNLLWPNHVSDLKYWKSEAAQAYNVNSIPQTFLIDKKGRIIAKGLRGEELYAKVAEILGK